jgi:hypothetical protein
MGLFDWLFGKSHTPHVRRRDAAPRKASPREAAPGGDGWQADDRVLASWVDAYFYPGRVRRVDGQSCEIAFDDGDVAWVHPANVRTPDIVVGSPVFCRYRAGPAYRPGTVRQQNGEKFQVEYDGGEKEWTTLSMVRVKRPLANVPGPPAEVRDTPAFSQGVGPGGGMPGAAPVVGTMTAAGPMPGPPPMPFIPDVGDPIDDSDWRIGDRALGRWYDLFWYPATILAIGTKGYHLLFDDGDQRIVTDRGLMPLDVEEGEELFIRPKNQPQRIYTPARVLRVDGEVIDVELEDGTHEANQKISRARLWRCPVGTRPMDFAEGDRVLAQDIDGFIYPAEVLSMDGDKFVVSFLDGPERMLTPELLRPFTLRTGTPVQCRWKGGQAYFPGKITRMEGDRVHIDYDDGDREWTTVRLVRLVPKEGA